jgi:hypothetical protein
MNHFGFENPNALYQGPNDAIDQISCIESYFECFLQWKKSKDD